MFDYTSRPLHVVEQELSYFDLWDYPEDERDRLIREITSHWLIPEIDRVMTGADFENLCFGYTSEWIEPYEQFRRKNRSRKGNRGFIRALAKAKKLVPRSWNASHPPKLFAFVLLYWIKRACESELRSTPKETKHLRIGLYPTVGTELDRLYGPDFVVFFGDRHFVTADITLKNEQADLSQSEYIDVVVRRDELTNDPEYSIEDLAVRIVEAFIRSKSYMYA